MTEDWTKQWERRTVNGLYPLRRFLGRSNHSVVFLTECAAQTVPQAAIKIMPANPVVTEAQLAHWKTVTTLSHPHLIRLFDAGRCQLGGHNFLFVVTDLAEQNLAQILTSRPLTAGEVRDLLPATLDALAYLHGKNMVQGGLKPSNFLVVDDQLKLAGDTIRPAGERTASTTKASLYDPPEVKKGRLSPAGDIWALGITLVEALTQAAPAWSRESFEGVSLPPNLAPEFVHTVKRCLNREPGHRPTVFELEAQFRQAPPRTPSAAPPAMPASAATPPSVVPPSPVAPSAKPPSAKPPSATPPVMSEPSAPTPSSHNSLDTQNPPKTRPLITTIAVVIVALCVLWTAIHLLHNQTGVERPASIVSPSPPPVSPLAVVVSPKASIVDPLPTVVHQELPDVSRSARASIRGIIKIAVRVTVERSGNVVAAVLDSRPSSKYFARATTDAAKKWTFSEAADPASRVWLLHFELTRTGTTVHAAALR